MISLPSLVSFIAAFNSSSVPLFFISPHTFIVSSALEQAAAVAAFEGAPVDQYLIYRRVGERVEPAGRVPAAGWKDLYRLRVGRCRADGRVVPIGLGCTVVGGPGSVRVVLGGSVIAGDDVVVEDLLVEQG